MYNNPINELIILDKKARDMLKAAKENSATERAKISQNRQIVQSAYADRSNKHLNALKETYRKNAEDELASAEELFKVNVQKLNGKYESNHKNWEDTIYKRCLE